jgi:hypothetical protein
LPIGSASSQIVAGWLYQSFNDLGKDSPLQFIE